LAFSPTFSPTPSPPTPPAAASTEAPGNLEYVPVGGFAARFLNRVASRRLGIEVEFQLEAFLYRVVNAALCDDDNRKRPMHGKRGENFKPLEKRRREGDFPKHIPPHSRYEKNCAAFLFGLLLGEIEKRGMHTRMKTVPKAARDAGNFEGKQGSAFLSSCQPKWTDMSRDQRLAKLKEFMLLKFSTDKLGEFFTPPDRHRFQQAKISWTTFYMYETEANDIAKSVIQMYVEQEPLLPL
jgi:hypothetical protein